MKRILTSIIGGALIVLAMVATVAAVEPSASPGTQAQARDTVPAILGLTQQQIMDLRHDGKSLAQIAQQQGVDPEVVVDALKAQWSDRIDVRVANGALTADEAKTLRDQLELRARDMVNRVTLGGMRGQAVGAGPGSGNGPMAGNGAGNGAMRGAGNGTCDGSGPHGAGRQ